MRAETRRRSDRRAADRDMVDAIRAMFGQRPLYGSDRRTAAVAERMPEEIPDGTLIADAYQLRRPK